MIAVDAPELLLPEPVGKQWEWLDNPAPRKVGRVGRRGTKTRFAFLAAMHGHGPGWDAGDPLFPGVLQGWDVIWFAQTYTNLSTVLWHEEIVPRMAHVPAIKLNETKHDVEVIGVGSLLLRSADPEAIKSIRGAGKRLKGVIIDEAAWLALRAALLDIILPALLDNDGWLIITSTTNAGKDGGYDDQGAPQIPSYFNQICQEIQDGKRSSDWWEFTGTAFDNPTLNPKAIRELIAEYPPDSPKLKQEVYAELLETGVGLALPGLSEKTHVVPAFPVPGHWSRFAAFDWAFYHLWVVGLYCVDEDGKVYKIDTIYGRLDLPEQIDAKARAGGLNVRSTSVFAGPDIWQARVKTKTEFLGPTIAEELNRLGWRLIPAANARVMGLNNLRRYTYIDPARQDVPPRFQFMDTPGNQACLAQMKRMTLDPKDPEDVLKVDADSAGRGGDDMYDETRYGLMSRPLTSVGVPPEEREGQAMGYDYTKNRQRERESGDSLMSNWLGGDKQSPTAGRHRVPVRRG